jgi:Tol biopolymer transport system component/predicted Ser/Thr protein kinase
MPLAQGDTLGHYEIIEPIGKGGMGEVYRAHDSRVGRDVAIKVSAAQFSERFEREVRAVAALNHPNICTLYDVGPNYLVMELVEGPTLSERIKEGPIPLDEALGIARQIAAALEHAHEKPIVHRDLKPGNVKIKPDGTVKVLDFGLAKIGPTSVAPASRPEENSPTLTIGMTEAGAILGTAAYMPPEQARGKPVDKRADIWAFGVVLYEMLTGERLFQGEDVVETLAAVVHKEPDLSRVPERVRRLLKRCLEKDPKKRLRDITGMEFLLEEPAAAASPPQARSQRWRYVVAAAVLAALVAVSVDVLFFHLRAPVEQTLRYTIAAPEGSTLHSFAISPDGRTLVIAAAVGGKRQLWMRPMDALQFQPMSFTEDAVYPFWSPDSRYIGFFAQGKLKKVAASGGPSQSLCDAPNGAGGSWNRDDVIVFAPEAAGAIQRVAAAGGVPADVMTRITGFRSQPVFLPDGRHFFYASVGAAEAIGVFVSSLDGPPGKSESRRVLPDSSGVVFARPERNGRSGHALFVRENTLMAAPFDPASAQVVGDVFPVADGVSLGTASYLPATVSENGVLLYSAGGSGAGASQLGWYDRAGKSLGPVGAPGADQYHALSPDEKAVVFARGTGNRTDLWVRDLSRGAETRFTSDASRNVLPFWSPQGDRIVFTSARKGTYNLYQKAASGSGQDELLLPNSSNDLPSQWSRDGRFIVYSEGSPKNKLELWVLPTDGAAADRKPIPFLRTEFNQGFGQLSPDSHWMAFTSDRSGRREVYVRPFPPGDGEWTISIAGGQAPRWRGDGKELFFEAADGKMMAVPVIAVLGAKPSFEAGAPVALFDAHIMQSPGSLGFGYEVTADGKRFLINTIAGAAATPLLTVVTNWSAGLNK